MSATKDLYAGIDVSKGRLETALRPSGEHFGLPNDQAGIDTLVGRLEGVCPKLVVSEATGGLQRAVAAVLAAAGIAWAVVNPRQVRDFAPRASSPRTTASTPRCSPVSPRPSACRPPRPSPTKKPSSSPPSSPGGARSSR